MSFDESLLHPIGRGFACPRHRDHLAGRFRDAAPWRPELTMARCWAATPGADREVLP